MGKKTCIVKNKHQPLAVRPKLKVKWNLIFILPNLLEHLLSTERAIYNTSGSAMNMHMDMRRF